MKISTTKSSTEAMINSIGCVPVHCERTNGWSDVEIQTVGGITLGMVSFYMEEYMMTRWLKTPLAGPIVASDKPWFMWAVHRKTGLFMTHQEWADFQALAGGDRFKAEYLIRTNFIQLSDER